ncbi:hypothetical protein FRB96_005436 [Tulasnella sp. 330]|nr:hypothetical protein FRB96_005436 [Tulasnella sp. 330]
MHTTGSPHPGVTVPELLLHYFKLLSDSELAVAAQVCTTWASIALDELWRAREVPLNALLTKLEELELLRDNGGANKIPAWVPRSDIDMDAVRMEGWKEFIDNYAHKITRLCVTVNISVEASDLIHELLRRYGGVLCPNVAHMLISSNDECLMMECDMALALGPSLTDLTMEGHNSEEVKSLAAAVLSFAPQIKRLVFRNPFRFWAYPFEIDCGIFRNLQVARLGRLSWQGWKMLASCEMLEAVTLSGSHQPDHHASIPTEDGYRPTFPSLRRLRIDYRSIGEEVLRESIMPALEYLRLDTFMSGAVMRVMSLGNVGRRSPLLKGLTIRDASGFFEDIIDGMSTMRSLTSINISGEIASNQLDDININLIVTHHPHLEALILKPNVSSDFTGGVTTNGLLALLQHCKALEYIDLPFDFSDLANRTSDVDLQSLVEIPSLTVTKAAIGIVLGLTNTRRAAQFLAKLLPNVTELGFSDMQLSSEQSKERSQFVHEFRQYRMSQHLMTATTNPQGEP